MIPEIDPVSLRRELDGLNPPRLLDVREADEWAVSHLDGAVHAPLMELSDRLGEFDPNADWVVICRVGGRSAKAVGFMLDQGFEHVRNLSGGMKEYARKVEPAMPVA